MIHIMCFRIIKIFCCIYRSIKFFQRVLHISDFLTDLAILKKDLQVILYPSGWYVVLRWA